MALPSHDTLVSYPDGATASTGTVLHVEPLDDGLSAVILDATAVHPIDTAWPDQPSDRGVLRGAAGEARIERAVMGGIHDGALLLGTDLPVRTGTEGWTFVVAHLVDGAAPAEGESVEVVADADLRAALSAGHTACHLASLALDGALSDSWTKETPRDALGNPAFDQLAIVTSRIHEHGSIDTYRIGKSLRRKGFAPAGLDDVAAVAARANALLAGWVAAGGAVRIERADAAITTRRTWVCALPEGEVRIPCGGTHVDDLAAFTSIEVALERTDVEGGIELVMTTTARMA
ncbi:MULTISPECIES: hypothetical protein [unclassified Microcella]|uniref:hypothetical protein n=1 Tax=unclassified Microcella TaxID=2630066 RepID=UPI0006F604C4|nr:MULTISPECIES: hypothetical protein [unclassified Microcella]KQV25101.1 metal-dependent hydrolase [Yonghaparkia sp. Root332]KRF31386.1 metal-dependent hydrolase [Yonghaparkia sp. Soil809]